MKKMICAVSCCLCVMVAVCQNRVVTEISNFKNDKGVCRACIFTTPASFNGEGGKPFECITVTVKNGAAVAVFSVPTGIYALFVFHDANSNNRIDKNFFGIPKEGYGASRNKLPFAGAPSYEENKFVVEDRQTTRLHVRIRNL